MPARGSFIVLEGLDGSGTTTQAGHLCALLERHGHMTTRTFEPSKGPIGQLIRQALEHRLLAEGSAAPHVLGWPALALLFAADRMDHLENTVLPALAGGHVVVSDRYRLSSFIYQSLTANSEAEALDWVTSLNARSLAPDLTVVLQISAAAAEMRRESRGGKRELFEVSEFQARLAEAYGTAERFAPGDHVVRVSAEGSEAEVTARIVAAVAWTLPELAL